MWWIINVGGLIGAWHYTNLSSESTFQNMICPIFVGIFLIGILLKIVLAIGPDKGTRDSGGGYFGGFGGDGGCGGN